MTNFKDLSRKMFRGTMIVLIIAELSGALSSAIDGMIVSRNLSADEMSAFGMSWPYFSIVCIISGIITIGCQELCVKYVAKGKIDKANSIFTVSCIFAVLVSLIITAIGLIKPEWFAVLFGATGNVSNLSPLVSQYVKGLVISAPFWIIFMILTPILQIDSDGKLVRIASVAISVVDVISTIIFVYVLKKGLFFVGLSKSLGFIVGALIALTHFFKKKKIFKFTSDLSEVKALPKLMVEGLPRAVSMIGRTIGPILLNIIIAACAAEAMVALSVQRSLSLAFAAAGWGIGGAVLILASLFYAEKNVAELKQTLRFMTEYIMFIVLILTVLGYMLAPQLTNIFISRNSAEYDLAVFAVKFYMLSLPFLAFNVSAASYFQAIKKNVVSIIINFCLECLSLVVFALVLTKMYGEKGFFVSFFVGEVFITLVIVVSGLINYLTHRDNKSSFVFLKNKLNLEKDNYVHKKILSVDDAIEFSKETSEFCKTHNIDSRNAYYLSLCVEEIACDLLEDKPSDKKNFNIDIKVSYIGDHLSLFVRNDFVETAKRWAGNDEDDAAHDLAVKMVLAAAEDIKYSNAIDVYTMVLNWKTA